MSLNLTGLDELALPAESNSGKPLSLPLSLIDPDPNQPRLDVKNDATLPELAENIKLKGVKTPISVRKNPANPERWIINFGERRYHASLMAGKETIPAFHDEEADDYDQVNENLKRKALSPYEMARFVSLKIKEGQKPKDVAAKLGVKVSFISEHYKLSQASESIINLSRSGDVGSKTLYMLASASKEHEKEIDAFIETCAGDYSQITRSSVTALLNRLNNKQAGTEERINTAPEAPAAPHGNETVNAAPETSQSVTEAPVTPQGNETVSAAPEASQSVTEASAAPQGNETVNTAPEASQSVTEASAAPAKAVNKAQEPESSIMVRVSIDGVDQVAVLVGKVKLKLIESDEEIEVNADEVR